MKKYLAFILPVFLVFAMGGCQDKVSQANSLVHRQVIPVKLTDVETRIFNHTLKVHGTLESKSFALVPAQIGGIIEEIFYDEGDVVKRGDQLCRLDDEKLGRNLEASRQNVEVAREVWKVSDAQLEKAVADLNKAEKDFLRFERLLREEAISDTEYEQMETVLITTRAAHKAANANVELSEARYKQAQAALDIARRSYADSRITAPIDGMISHRFYELGEMAEKGKSVYRIDDPSILELSVFVPGTYYREIIPGKTSVHLHAGGIELGSYPVSYKSPTVDARLRTFELKCEILNSPKDIVAGLLCTATIILDSRMGKGIPASAIVRRTDRMVIFTVQDEIAKEITVETGFKSDGLIEITHGLDETVKTVVTHGHSLLEDGSPVRRLEMEMES